MSDNVTLFPNILQPATALKAYAPIGVKFWENQESVLKGWKEFADGWFSRRQVSAQAALEAAKHIGDANASSDIFWEYQNWFTRAMELLAEDGKAYQQQVLKAGAQLSAKAGRATDRLGSRELARPRYLSTPFFDPASASGVPIACPCATDSNTLST